VLEVLVHLDGADGMSRYAENTQVSSEASRGEIERTLRRYGASEFAYGWDKQQAALMFALGGRRIRFALPMPDPTERRFTHTPGRGLVRDAAAREREYERAVRQRWRALALVIKAKLEAVDSGITTVEHEFLAHVLLPNGSTVGEWVGPQVETAYAGGAMPSLLPGASS
jgi:hypothetical protein